MAEITELERLKLNFKDVVRTKRRTNDRLRIAIKALNEIVVADTVISDGGKVHDHGASAGIAIKALADLVGNSRDPSNG